MLLVIHALKEHDCMGTIRIHSRILYPYTIRNIVSERTDSECKRSNYRRTYLLRVPGFGHCKD